MYSSTSGLTRSRNEDEDLPRDVQVESWGGEQWPCRLIVRRRPNPNDRNAEHVLASYGSGGDTHCGVDGWRGDSSVAMFLATSMSQLVTVPSEVLTRRAGIDSGDEAPRSDEDTSAASAV